MKLRLAAAAALALAAIGAANAGADTASERAPGLCCRLEADGGASDARLVDRVALHVEAGASATELLPAGPFRARFTGELALDLRSKLRFRVVGSGTAKLTVGEQVVVAGGDGGALDLTSEELRFPQGASAFQFDYASPRDGAATVRLLWSGRGFDWEPLPPALFHRDSALDPSDLLDVRRGRELFAARRCVRCHSAEPSAPIERHGMAELAAGAPSLEAAGDRLHGDWIAHWIVAPRTLRPSARMPRLLHADDPRAQDLAAFLLRRQSPADVPSLANRPPPDASQVAAGGVLFARRGCIACHTRPDRAEANDDADRVPLHRVAWKWQAGALAAFLRDPTSIDPWIRMPDLHLSDAEASALAAFLLDRSAPFVPAPTPGSGDAERGARAYVELRCDRCHEPAAVIATPRPAAPPLASLAGVDWSAAGCAAEPTARGELCPDFELPPADRAALQRFARSGLASLERRSPADFAERQMRELQCDACHTIGAQLDRWQSVMAETNDLVIDAAKPTLDQARPPLTFVGEKLHSDWIARLLSGENAAPTRPWLAARMPAFPARAELLAQGLAARDGFARSRSQPEPADAALEAIGAALVSESGFSCVSCHDVAARGALSRFEFGAPNLDLAHARIRPDYFRRWMNNPMRVEPSSKMPKYAGDDGKSPFPAYCDGDLAAQFEAIRRYLAALHAQRR